MGFKQCEVKQEKLRDGVTAMTEKQTTEIPDDPIPLFC
jgi:hypothetical protein